MYYWYKCVNCGTILGIYEGGMTDYDCGFCGADEFNPLPADEYEEVIMELYEQWKLSK